MSSRRSKKRYNLKRSDTTTQKSIQFWETVKRHQREVHEGQDTHKEEQNVHIKFGNCKRKYQSKHAFQGGFRSITCFDGFNGWGLHDCTLKESAGVRCNKFLTRSIKANPNGNNYKNSSSSGSCGDNAKPPPKGFSADEAENKPETVTLRDSISDSIVDIMKKLLLARRRK